MNQCTVTVVKKMPVDIFELDALSAILPPTRQYIYVMCVIYTPDTVYVKHITYCIH